MSSFKCLSSQHTCCDVRASTDVAQNVFLGHVIIAITFQTITDEALDMV